ncbi:MAG: bifunctional glycogen debranching protein GlgX/4-alpha-glucanotransferase [Dethiobacteria bacterium]
METDRFWHNSHDTFFRNPFGAVPCHKRIVLRFAVKNKPAADYAPAAEKVSLFLIREKNGKSHTEELPMTLEKVRGDRQIFIKEISAPEEPCLLWYYFMIRDGGALFYYGNSSLKTGGLGCIADHVPPSYQITIYREGFRTPTWLKEAVIYQIFPDRFYNGLGDGKVLNPKKESLIHSHWENTPVYIRDPSGRVIRWDFFGGNLEGIRKKLPYLKNLGVSLLYFNPVFESPSNHRYDTADYHKIDPMLGTDEQFAQLCKEAAGLGIYIILDGVFSHTGSDSIYFNKEGNYPGIGAFQSPDSPYYGWYRFLEYPHRYDCWWGIDTLPNVNELNLSYMNLIIYGENSVLKKWLAAGIKGWRLDVADELPGEFLKKLHEKMKELDSESVLIGEVWEDASNKISYGERREYFLGDELDGVTNYPLRSIILNFALGHLDAEQVEQSLMGIFENYPLQSFYSTMNLLGNHDVPRLLTVLQDGLPQGISREEKERLKFKRLQLVTLWQLTFPGVPCIYYGDEAGLEGGKDPSNRGTYPWGREDKDLLDWYRTLIALRNHYDVLRSGWWKTVCASGSVYAYTRVVEGGRGATEQVALDNAAIIILNRDVHKEKTVSIDPGSSIRGNVVDLLDDYRKIFLTNDRLELTLKPLECRILLNDRWSANLNYTRESGILLHPTSLPSRFGIGDMGKGAYGFLDFLVQSEQRYWQILPLNPPGLGQSPYQCFSAFAGNPLLIDLDRLSEGGLLMGFDEKSLPEFPENRVDFGEVMQFKEKNLRKAFQKFTTLPQNPDYEKFCRQNAGWLEDYALFMALKRYFEGKPWNQWEEAVATRRENALKKYREGLSVDIEYHKFLQFIFFSQWEELKKDAGEKGIRLIGDLPIFISHDSADVWCNPHLFELDAEGNPLKVAGVPPDYFSEKGQLWGHPHYRWGEMEKDNYRWWEERFKVLFRLVDLVRIDHFRGFEAYWEVPAGGKDATEGRWVKGPGEKFFFRLQEALGDFPVIAEDLGVITPEVEEMKTRLGYPGMKVLQFMIKPHLDQKLKLPLFDKENVLYTGTHDNDTLLGWYATGKKGEKGEKLHDEKEVCWHFIEMALRSDARIVIIPLQDILCLGSEARMNLPGTAEGNWQWRFPGNLLNGELAGKLRDLTEKYHRTRSASGIPGVELT